MAPTAVLGLGDFQYEDGTLVKYHAAYDLSWGRLKAITYPAPGNDHDQSGAGDYLTYWASRLPSTVPFQPYSFDLGTWHVVSLPSNCRNPAIDCTGRRPGPLAAPRPRHAPRGCTLASSTTRAGTAPSHGTVDGECRATSPGSTTATCSSGTCTSTSASHRGDPPPACLTDGGGKVATGQRRRGNSVRDGGIRRPADGAGRATLAVSSPRRDGRSRGHASARPRERPPPRG